MHGPEVVPDCRSAHHLHVGLRGHFRSRRVHMRVPVCAQHREATTRPRVEPMQADDSGELKFASYRFYKAFVITSHIGPSGSERLPAARVRS